MYFKYFLMQYKKELNLARKIAKKVAKLQRKKYELDNQKYMKVGHDFATQVDLESEKIIISTIKKKFPNHSIIAEESENSEKSLQDEWCWIIDPLDGTHCFANKIPFFGPSIALLHKNKPVVGVLNFPMLKEEYFAIKDQGAYFNNKKIKIKSCENIQGSQVSMGSSTVKYSDFSKNLLSTFSSLFSVPCLIESARRVLRGFVPGSPENTRIKIWDYAAANLIVYEAGGKMSDWKGQRLPYDKISFTGGVLITAPLAQKPFLDLLEKTQIQK